METGSSQAFLTLEGFNGKLFQPSTHYSGIEPFTRYTVHCSGKFERKKEKMLLVAF